MKNINSKPWTPRLPSWDERLEETEGFHIPGWAFAILGFLGAVFFIINQAGGCWRFNP